MPEVSSYNSFGTRLGDLSYFPALLLFSAPCHLISPFCYLS